MNRKKARFWHVYKLLNDNDDVSFDIKRTYGGIRDNNKRKSVCRYFKMRNEKIKHIIS